MTTTSMAHVSANWRYTRPQLTAPGEGDIIIKGSRHPCLETMDQINFIANDVSLTRGPPPLLLPVALCAFATAADTDSYTLIADKSRVQIITGPNMGGKSTYALHASST
jgi:DNA mismatch repair protein MSH2